jgi:hypothetical protein
MLAALKAIQSVAEDLVPGANGGDLVDPTLWDGGIRVSPASFSFRAPNGLKIDVLIGGDQGETITAFDVANNQPWSSETSTFDAYQRLQSLRVEFDGGGRQLRLYDPSNTHPYDELEVSEDATGRPTAASMRIDGQPATTDFSSVGQVLGSALGRALAPNNQFVQIAASTVVGAAGQKLALAFSASLLRDASTVDLASAFADFNVSLAGAGAGSVASFLVGEIGHALGVPGFGADFFNAGAGGLASSVANQITTSMLRDGLSFSAAVGELSWASAATGAGYGVSGALGGFLGRELVPAQTHEGAVGGQLLGAVGSAVGISLALGNLLGGVLDFILPGVGSLIGTIVGTLIGDALGSQPHPAAVDMLERAGSLYGFLHSQVSASDGGDYRIADPMAAAADSIVNAYFNAVHGAAFDHNKQVIIGYLTDPDFRYATGTPGHVEHRFIDPDDAVQTAALDVLQHSEVIGGDLLLKRAHHNSPSNIPQVPRLDENGNFVPLASVAEQLTTMSGDLSVAQDYENYLNNKEAINALMAANPDSAFTAGWIATFARVNDLGLNHVAASDFLGGLVGWLDSVKKAGLVFDAAGVSFDQVSNTSLIDIKVANGTFVPGALSAFADQMTETSDASGTTLHFVLTNGLVPLGFRGPDSVTMVSGEWQVAGGPGNNLWFGSNANSSVFTAAGNGNDILVGGSTGEHIHAGDGWNFVDGGDGADWITSGSGNDILHGGRGSDLLQGGDGDDSYTFDRGDGSDTVDDSGGSDTLAFGPGIGIADVSVSFSGNNLIVAVKDPAHPGAVTDWITLQDWALANNRIEYFRFADGAAMDVGPSFGSWMVPFGATFSGRTVVENSPNGTVVGTVTGFDLDANAGLRYSFVETPGNAGSAGGRFAIDAVTGTITVAASWLLDYESWHSHDVTVRTTDAAGHAFDKPFAIAVTDVFEAPSGLTLSNNSVAENSPNGTVVGIATAIDNDPHAQLSYALIDTAGGRFAINAQTGAVTVANSFLTDYESWHYNVIAVRTADAAGHTFDKAFTIDTIDVFEAPSGLMLSNSSVAENSANGTVVGIATGIDNDPHAVLSYALRDDAGGRFAINAQTGAVTVANSFLMDYESWHYNIIAVRTADAAGHTFDKAFTIDTIDVFEAPSGLTLSNSSVAENSANGTVVGIATGIDSDPHAVLSYALLDNAGGRFAINAQTGAVTVANSFLMDYESWHSNNITITITDAAGHAFNKTFTIDTIDVFEAPSGLTLSNSSVAENSPNGTVVGTATGIDSDPHAVLSYALLDNAGGRFAINAQTGAVTVANGALLDYESWHSNNITVTTTDAAGHAFNKTFTIDTIDVPELTGGPGNDRLYGTPLADVMDGGAGDDVLTGWGGDDHFVFRFGSGADVITDFAPGLGSDDSLDLTALATTYTLAQVMARATQHGADTVIDFGGGDSITLQNVARASLTDADFGYGFRQAEFKLASFGASAAAGGFQSDHVYPRELADINGDGRADIVAFGGAGAYVSLAAAGGNFPSVSLSLASFGADGAAGGWANADLYPRQLADINGDGKADIVGFGSAGAYVSLATGGGNFGSTALAINSFAANAGGWNSDNLYHRALADINGDGKADIVGFGSGGVYVSLATGGGSFGSVSAEIQAFGVASSAGSWSSDNLFHRELADVNGDGKADIVGFGGAGVYVSLATGGGHFASPQLALNSFGTDGAAGGWSSEDQFPRHLADINGDHRADIVGFGNDRVYVALGRSDGSFDHPVADLDYFGRAASAGGWSSADVTPRELADVNGDGAADIVGFASNGVLVSLVQAGYHFA